MEELVFAILLLALSFLLRVIFILRGTSDDWVTWWIIHHQRGKALHYRAADSLIAGEIGTARLQYLLLSRLPERLWGPVGNLSNALYDCIAVLAVYGVASALLPGRAATETLAGLTPGMWVALLFATTPILMPWTARLRGIKARTLGSLLSLAYFLSLGGAFLGAQPWLYPVVIASGILVVLSSAFAMQNVAFLSLWLSLFYWDPVPFGVFLGTLAIGAVLPRAGVRTVLRLKLEHYRWYIRNYADSIVAGRNQLRNLWRLPQLLVRSPREFLDQFFRELTPVILLHSVPGLFVLFYFCIPDWQVARLLVSDEPSRYAAAIVAGTLLVTVLTSTRRLGFLGESERYFEYAAPFVSFLLVSLTLGMGRSADFLPWLLLFHFVSILGSFCFVMAPDFLEAFRPVGAAADAEVAEFLRKLGGERRILTIPVKYGWALSAQLDEPTVRFYQMFVAGPGGDFRYMDRDLERYDWPRRDLEHFRRQYGVDTIVVRKPELEGTHGRGIEYALRAQDRIFENEEYAVYRLPEPSDPES